MSKPHKTVDKTRAAQPAALTAEESECLFDAMSPVLFAYSLSTHPEDKAFYKEIRRIQAKLRGMAR